MVDGVRKNSTSSLGTYRTSKMPTHTKYFRSMPIQGSQFSLLLSTKTILSLCLPGSFNFYFSPPPHPPKLLPNINKQDGQAIYIYICFQSQGNVKYNLNEHSYCLLIVEIIQRWILFHLPSHCDLVSRSRPSKWHEYRQCVSLAPCQVWMPQLKYCPIHYYYISR